MWNLKQNNMNELILQNINRLTDTVKLQLPKGKGGYKQGSMRLTDTQYCI